MRLISHLENRNGNKYETKMTQRLPPFSTKMFFHHINITVWEPVTTPKIFCEFHKNKTRIFNDELVFKVVGLVGTEPQSSYLSFKTHMKFRDISISAVESSNGLYNNQFQINFSYNRLMYNYLTLPWTQHYLPTHKHEKLIKRIKAIVPTMVHDNINHNEKFIHVLHSSFCHNPKQRILSSYPDFPLNEDQYYYFIPEVTFYGVKLIDVKIEGLSNFESLKPNHTFGNSAYTLLVKKVRGSMNLDNKEFQNFEFYVMKFAIDYLFITVDYETKRLVVEARDYTVKQASTKPPRESIFSTVIMQSIEAAIASQIMPSLEVSHSNELDQPSIKRDTENSIPQEITDSSADSESTFDATVRSIIMKRRKHTTPLSRYGRFSSAIYEFILKKSLRSSSTRSSTKIATTSQTGAVSDNKTPQSSSTTETSTTSQTTTQTPQSTDSVTQTKKCSTNAETSPKMDCTKIAQSDQVLADVSQKSSSANAEDDPYDYDISFHNVTIKLISGSPYPKGIQCGFFDNLKINHLIHAIPNGNIRLNNKGSAININFHANFTGIEIAVVKPGNNSEENATCEFQIHNNQDIKVILPPKKNNTGANEDLKIKNKIDKTLMSAMKERITRTIKPLFCLPFKFCSQSIQMIDDFFLRFVDNVLKKCSLRRTTTT